MPGDPADTTARLPWNTNYDDVYPQAVLQAADATDVQRAVDFCRDTGVRPIPRSGGHSFQGFSTGTGLIIDLAGMRQVQMNAARTRARIGAGANLLHVYEALFSQGRMAIAGGTCPTVGISGLTQGGGKPTAARGQLSASLQIPGRRHAGSDTRPTVASRLTLGSGKPTAANQL
jgi:FAD/FMN-containing dehydrogenase